MSMHFFLGKEKDNEGTTSLRTEES